MENKINIVELLKDCPSGMELDCTMYENVYFDKIYDEDCLYQIGCYTINDGVRNSINFTKYGKFNTTRIAKCVIFPKGKTTWEGFVPPCKFKDGDILTYTGNYTTTFIYRNKENEPNYSTSFYVGCSDAPTHNFLIYNKYTLIALNGNCDVHLATEEEKAKLFQAIKDNGYRWNPETKTLEKLIEPKFKVGDKITKIDGSRKGEIYYTDVDKYHVYVENYTGIDVFFEDQDDWELVPNKFDITTLKPFDKVLVRQDVYGKWGINFFCFNNYDEGYYYTTGNWIYKQCIPYNDDTKHLIGTTDDCDEFYKTW